LPRLAGGRTAERMRTENSRAGLLFVVLSALVACGDADGTAGPTTSATTASSSSGSGGDGGAGGGGVGGGACVSGLMQADPACTACQDQHCCATASIAHDDPGVWTGSAAKICREANCSAECGVPEPECGGIVPSPASCADDLYALCCAESTACAKSDACTALIYICIDDRGCAPNSACFDACALEFPGGNEIFQPFLECFNDVVCT
jgi:hypothetical protein